MKKQYLIFICLFSLQNILASPSCTENEKGCIKCNLLNNLCLKCKNDILIPDNDGGCIGIKKCKLGNNYCQKCNEKGDLCDTCEEGYYPDKNGACSYVDKCALSFQGECFQCENNYFLVYKTKLCKSLYSTDLKNCQKINETNGFCDICEEGYYLNKGDKTCTLTENCYSSSFGICNSCNEGYYLDKKNEKCIKQEKNFLHCKETIDNVNCDKCDEDYFFSEDGFCVGTNFCSKSSDNLCTECINGYYLTEKNNYCSYDKNCYIADIYTGFCNSCKNGFYLDKKNGKCYSNTEKNEFIYCKIVENNICLSCEDGYYLGDDNFCSISKNCMESENGLCFSCREDYYLGLDHKCTIYENCIYSNKYDECLECEEGYYFDMNNQSCKINTEEFEHCKHSNQFGGYCADCKDGYYLTIRDKICRSNEEEDMFYKCKVTDYDDFCSECIEGYYLSSGDKRCSKVDGCKFIKNENECYECSENNCLNRKNNTCYWNFVINEIYEKIYYKCNYTNLEGTRCEVCDENNTLSDEGLCVNYYDCKEFENGICTQCEKENIYGALLCLNKEFGCVDTFFEGCKRCDNTENFYICTECSDGYILNEYNECDKIYDDI